MKKVLIYLSLLISFAANAQEKIWPKDFGYNNKVKQIDEIYYKYNAADKRYNIDKEQTLYFTNGKLTHSNSLSTLLGLIEYDNYYTYNATGQLLTCTEKINGVAQGKYNYTYKNGKLMVKSGMYKDKKEESTFEYDTRGQLAKITFKKESQVLWTSIFSKYKTAGTYTETTTFYTNEKPNSLNVKNYQDGKLVAEGSRFGEKDPLIMQKMEYDDKGNLISSISTLSSATNIYEYDDEGNAIRTLLGGRESKGEKSANVFRFSKITYVTGMVLGTTNLNSYFVNRYEPKSVSYSAQSKLKRPLPGTQPSNPFALYDLLTSTDDEELKMYASKNADGTYQVLDETGKDITQLVARIKAPNGLDLLVYDSAFEDVFFFKNFYTASAAPGVKLKGQILPVSANGAYFVRANQGKNAYMIYQGKYLPLSEYQAEKSANGLDLYINKEGKTIFVLKNYYDNNLVKEDAFYPAVKP